MEQETVTIDKAGRAVIPARVRKALGIKPGGKMTLLLNEDSIELITPRAALRRAQVYFSQFKKPGVSYVDELIAEKRAEARREEEEMERWAR